MDKLAGIGIEIHLIVSDHPGGVLVKTRKKSQGVQSAMPIIYTTGTVWNFELHFPAVGFYGKSGMSRWLWIWFTCPNSIMNHLQYSANVKLWAYPSSTVNISFRHNRILAPCNCCHHPWCFGHKSYHKALLIMFGCDGISDHASWNEVFHYRDTKLSCQT